MRIGISWYPMGFTHGLDLRGEKKEILGLVPDCLDAEPRSHPGTESQVAEIAVPTQESFHPMSLSWIGREEGMSNGCLMRGIFFSFLQ